MDFPLSVVCRHFLFPPFYSKIELCELQRFLWAQSSSRLSDELFDELTFYRSLCDPADGTLEPPGFLEFSSRLLARYREEHRSSAASHQKLVAGGWASGKEWASTLTRRGGSVAAGAQDLGESVETQVKFKSEHLGAAYQSLISHSYPCFVITS